MVFRKLNNKQPSTLHSIFVSGGYFSAVRICGGHCSVFFALRPRASTLQGDTAIWPSQSAFAVGIIALEFSHISRAILPLHHALAVEVALAQLAKINAPIVKEV